MPASTEQGPARRYRIERYLTEGGMGAIYVGKKLGPGGFEKEVVLKQLLPEYTARPEFRDLFFREAKISATLDHANIVHTFDLVESEESLFIVMEYVRGVDLRTIIRRSKLRRRELIPAAALHITLEILAGLSYAHNRRTPSGQSMAIIHRDVSPSNILCSAQGEVKLSDFGIAKAATHSSAFYRVRGKVGYMSPEQARNQPIDHRSDLYSVAVCLYEALTLERLFVGDLSTPADVIYSQPIVPPSQKRIGLPPALDVVLATALSADPNDRYQDAVAFADAIRQVGHRHGLLYSAPQLGEHLRYILGGDPQKWLNDEQAALSGDPHTQEIPGKKLEGKEAKSIGVVEASNLYVLSGSDILKSPGATPPPPNSRPAAPPPPPKPPLLRRPPAARSPMEFRIDEEEDISDEPTKVRDPFPMASAAPGLTPPPPVGLTPPPPIAATPPPPVGLTPPPPVGLTPPPPVGLTPPPPIALTPPPPIVLTPPPPVGLTPPPPIVLAPPPPALTPPLTPPPPVAETPPPPLTARAPLARPARRPLPPPPPPRAAVPPPLPESPFDIPPTPPPVDPGAEEFALTPAPFPPTPPPAYGAPPSAYEAPSATYGAPPPAYEAPSPTYAAPPLPPAYPPPGFGGPPPGLPRPSGSFGAPLPPPQIPAPAPALYDPSSGFPAFPPQPQPFDFGAPPVEMPHRSRIPAVVVLIVLLGAAAGGAKLAEIVTRADVAALDAQTAPPASAPSATSPEHK